MKGQRTPILRLAWVGLSDGLARLAVEILGVTVAAGGLAYGLERPLSGALQHVSLSALLSRFDLSAPVSIFYAVNLALAAIGLTVAVERFSFQLTKYRTNSESSFEQIAKLVRSGNVDRAVKLCEGGGYPILELIKSGLAKANASPEEIAGAMDKKLAELRPQAEKRIGFLWRLASVATLVGLLGTVFGLVRTFSLISGPALSPADKQRMLSNGIAEAMRYTAFGLGIAMFCIIAHIVLHTRARNIQRDLDKTKERVVNLLSRRQIASMSTQ